ncbi:MAG: hypothetical protein AAF371_02900 [Pseudomonadota bacterium]
MSLHVPVGALPVGTLDTLPPLEAAAVRGLRLWFSGQEAQAAVWNVFARTFGARQGRASLRAFESFVDTLLEASPRPLMRHGLACRCLGADEHAFAALLSAAARGEREEAILLALAFVPAHHALPLVAAAEAAGPILARVADPLAALIPPARPAPASAAFPTLH